MCLFGRGGVPVWMTWGAADYVELGFMEYLPAK
jgi:hypothetical protein